MNVHSHSHILAVFVLIGASGLLASCDQVVPELPEIPVIEAYVIAGQPLPAITVRSVQALSVPRSEVGAGVDDAHIVLLLNDQAHAYSLIGGGRYGPTGAQVPVVGPGDRFELEVIWRDLTVRAGGVVPPPLSISDLTVSSSGDPIPAILVETLAIGLDSLDLGLDAARGYVYPVQVDVAWNMLDGGWWLEAQLIPDDAFSSSILDFFLLPNAVFPEDPSLSGVWKGVYAVPVPAEDSPFPPHELMVALVRGNRAFAQWAETRTTTRSGTALGNVPGAIGYVGGIAMDSVRIQLPQPQ